jgi:DNA polymerase
MLKGSAHAVLGEGPIHSPIGATAVLALAGKPLAICKNRGPMKLGSYPGFITIHPSFQLRMREQDKVQAWKDFVADLRRIRKLSQGGRGTA